MYICLLRSCLLVYRARAREEKSELAEVAFAICEAQRTLAVSSSCSALGKAADGTCASTKLAVQARRDRTILDSRHDQHSSK